MNITEVGPGTHQRATSGAAEPAFNPYPAPLNLGIERCCIGASAQKVARVATELMEAADFNERRDITREARPRMDSATHARRFVAIEGYVAEVEGVQVRTDVSQPSTNVEVDVAFSAGAEAQLALDPGAL